MVEESVPKEVLDLGSRIIVFIGPEGSGKTTIAMKLAEIAGKPYITTGSIMRDLAANDRGALGDECRDMFAKHTYLSGATLLGIYKNRFSQKDTSDGFILDGGLRTMEETVGFVDMLDQASLSTLPLTVVYLKIPESVSYERLVFGENARKRPDDTQEGVAKRLSKFYFQLEDRIAEINKQGNWELVVVDAEPPIEEVSRFVYRVFGKTDENL